MATFQTILLTALLVVWLGISIGFLFSMVQTAVYEHRREKREQERDQRDLAYHAKRMESLEKGSADIL